MADIPITDAMIKLRTTPKVFERGESYYQDGSVLSIIRRGSILTAEVEGSEDEPYLVSVIFSASGIEEADCTCPYGEEWDGWCKHIVATLLFFRNEPGRTEERLPLKTRLDKLSREQLESLLLTLTVRDPALLLDLEERLARIEKQRPKPSER